MPYEVDAVAPVEFEAVVVPVWLLASCSETSFALVPSEVELVLEVEELEDKLETSELMLTNCCKLLISTNWLI